MSRLRDLLNGWTRSELETALAGLETAAEEADRPRGSASWHAALEARLEDQVENLRIEQGGLSVHTPEGQARYYEIRGEIAAKEEILSDGVLGLRKVLEEAIGSCPHPL